MIYCDACDMNDIVNEPAEYAVTQIPLDYNQFLCKNCVYILMDNYLYDIEDCSEGYTVKKIAHVPQKPLFRGALVDPNEIYWNKPSVPPIDWDF